MHHLIISATPTLLLPAQSIPSPHAPPPPPPPPPPPLPPATRTPGSCTCSSLALTPAATGTSSPCYRNTWFLHVFLNGSHICRTRNLIPSLQKHLVPALVPHWLPHLLHQEPHPLVIGAPGSCTCSSLAPTSAAPGTSSVRCPPCCTGTPCPPGPSPCAYLSRSPTHTGRLPPSARSREASSPTPWPAMHYQTGLTRTLPARAPAHSPCHPRRRRRWVTFCNEMKGG